MTIKQALSASWPVLLGIAVGSIPLVWMADLTYEDRYEVDVVVAGKVHDPGVVVDPRTGVRRDTGDARYALVVQSRAGVRTVDVDRHDYGATATGDRAVLHWNRSLFGFERSHRLTDLQKPPIRADQVSESD